jgi:hypothetical protein
MVVGLKIGYQKICSMQQPAEQYWLAAHSLDVVHGVTGQR